MGCMMCVVGCGPMGAEFERVPPPLAFAEVRETSRWCSTFDAKWWKAIDDSYTVYDQEVEELILRDWDQFATLATQERMQSKQVDARAARSLLARMRGVEQKSNGLEIAFIDRCRETLPPESKEFLELFSARRRFERAGSTWISPSEALPGPLELLALDGPPINAPQLIEAAIGVYSRSAEVLERERRKRFTAYLEFIETNTSAIAVLGEVEAAHGKQSPKAKQHAAIVSGCRDVLQSAHDASDEAVRRALSTEAQGFASFIEDPARRADFEERILQCFVVEGLSAPASRAQFAVLRAIAERMEVDADRVKRLAEIAAFETTWTAEWGSVKAALRDSASVPQGALLARAKQLKDKLDHFAAPSIRSNAPEFDRLMRLVAARVLRAEDAAAQLTGEIALIPKVEVVEDALAQSRDRGMRLFVGWPLHPESTSVIAAALNLDAAQAVRVEEIRREEATRLAERTAPVLEKVKDVSRELQNVARDSVDMHVRRVMQQVRAHLLITHALDGEANARFINRVAEEMHVSTDDARWRVPRLTAALLCEVGAKTAEGEGESLGGVTDAAALDLFDLPRAAGLTAVEEELFNELVLAHALELLDAAHAARERMLMNVSRIFRVLAMGGDVGEYWETFEAGAVATELRFAILSESRRVLGGDAADRVERAFRLLVVPGLECERSMLIDALRECAEDSSTAPELAAVAAVAVIEADARRTRALRDATRWRAHRVLSEPLRSEEAWNALARISPMGALLRQRSIDADERALAAVARVVNASAMPDWLREGIESFEARRVRQFFPERREWKIDRSGS